MANPILADFLKVWPLERLRSMTIDEYTGVENKETYTQWLESKTDSLGSIWGGSSFKFGIYRRKSTEKKQTSETYLTDGKFSWLKKFGDTPEIAFETVRAKLVAAADSALRGDSASIETLDLSPVLKWKTACLYQDQEKPVAVTIFSDQPLMYLAFADPAAKRSFSEAYTALLKKIPSDRDVFMYMESEWGRWKTFQGSVCGLISSEDEDQWKNEIMDAVRQGKKAVVWWTNRPSGREPVLAQLRLLVAGSEHKFPYYYTTRGIVQYRARVIDIAVSEDYASRKPKWVDAYGFKDDFGEYKNERHSANVAFLIDEMVRLDGSLAPDDFEYWGEKKAPTQDNLQPFVSIRKAVEIEGPAEPATRVDLPAKNVIYYGPPGTGKTFFLKDRLFDRFSKRTSGKDRGRWMIEEAENLSWWKVVAATLLATGASVVPELAEHEFIKAKIATTSQKNHRAMIWSMLQQHTFMDCVTVKYSKRAEPQLFRKDSNSVWSIDTVAAEEAIPDVVEFVARAEKYTGEPSMEKNWEFMTFHQSMSYEDFIEGIKPVLHEEIAEPGLQYELQDGIFKRICRRARLFPDREFALFIDEINRGNVAGIFGELISLIEEDKREGAEHELEAILPYSRETFTVPSNLHIIGTMNSADRSVEALDTALRRRFAFVEMEPDPGLLGTVGGVDLQKLLVRINARLEVLRDRDHRIGHAYLIKAKSLDELKAAFMHGIIPLLKEYFYGDWSKIALVLGRRFVEDAEATVSWPKGMEGDVEDVVERSWRFTNPSAWDAKAFISIYE